MSAKVKLGIGCVVLGVVMALGEILGLTIPTVQWPFVTSREVDFLRVGGAEDGWLWFGWLCVVALLVTGVVMMILGQKRSPKSPLAARRWQRFRSITRGYVSLWVLGVMALLACCGHWLVGKEALAVKYEGEWTFPALVREAEVPKGKVFGLEGEDGEKPVDYRLLQRVFAAEEGSENTVVMPLVPFDPAQDTVRTPVAPLKEVDGVWMLGGEPFSGYAGEVYDVLEPEKMRVRYRFREGVKDGPVTGWDASGAVVYSGSYVEGELVTESYSGVRTGSGGSLNAERSSEAEGVYEGTGSASGSPDAEQSSEAEGVAGSEGTGSGGSLHAERSSEGEGEAGSEGTGSGGSLDAEQSSEAEGERDGTGSGVSLRSEQSSAAERGSEGEGEGLAAFKGSLTGELVDVQFFPAAPSADSGHWLGTTSDGYDLVAYLYGGLQMNFRAALFFIPFVYLIGVSVGLLMGYFGGWFDLVVQRLIEVFSNIPLLFVLIIVSASIPEKNRGLGAIILILVLFGWMGMTYLMRTAALKERERDYVAASRVIGAGTGRIVFRHILPNTVAILVTLVPFSVSGLIMSLTSLDYLGFGLPPQYATWGLLLKDGLANLSSPWLVSSAFVCLVSMLILITFVGEAVREAFDPKKFMYYR